MLLINLQGVISTHAWQLYIAIGTAMHGSYMLLVRRMQIRVESGLDDPDNVGHLGHFSDGSSGSHPQTKLSGCDPGFLVHYI